MSSSTQVLEQINALAQNGAWAQLAAVCEDFELDVSNTKVLPFYGVQLFSYLIIDNLNAARHLWRRIPDHIKAKHGELASIWAIAKQIFIGDTKAMFAASAAQDWEPLLALLNNKFLSSYRARTLSLLSKSYDNISLASLAGLLGMPEDEAQRYATRSGWTFDSATSYLQPGSAAKSSPQTIPLSGLGTLTSYVVHLEPQ